MLPDRVSNPGPLTYESGALSIALRGRQEDTKVYVKVPEKIAKLSKHLHQDYPPFQILSTYSYGLAYY